MSKTRTNAEKIDSINAEIVQLQLERNTLLNQVKRANAVLLGTQKAAELLHDIFCESCKTSNPHNCQWSSEKKYNDASSLWDQESHNFYFEKAKGILDSEFDFDIETLNVILYRMKEDFCSPEKNQEKNK